MGNLTFENTLRRVSTQLENHSPKLRRPSHRFVGPSHARLGGDVKDETNNKEKDMSLKTKP